jgi:hypothetical protein
VAILVLAELDFQIIVTEAVSVWYQVFVGMRFGRTGTYIYNTVRSILDLS